MLKRVILLAVLMSAGCATVGHNFNEDAADKFTPGVTTMDQAIAALGKPSSYNYYDDGSVFVVWQYVSATAVSSDYKSLAIMFDKDHKMVRIAQRQDM